MPASYTCKSENLVKLHHDVNKKLVYRMQQRRSGNFKTIHSCLMAAKQVSELKSADRTISILCDSQKRLVQIEHIHYLTNEQNLLYTGLYAAGKELGRHSFKDQPKTKYGIGSMALLGWSEWRNGIAEHVPADCNHLGKRFSHLRHFHDHVQLSFADGDATVQVGADGTFSKIRQHTLADGLPTFAVSYATSESPFASLE